MPKYNNLKTLKIEHAKDQVLKTSKNAIQSAQVYYSRSLFGKTFSKLTPAEKDAVNKHIASKDNELEAEKIIKTKELIRRLYFTRHHSLEYIEDKIGLATSVIWRYIKQIKNDMVEEVKRREEEDNKTVIHELQDRYHDRLHELYSTHDNTENPFARVLAMKELRENDKDHVKFLQSIGYMKNELPNSLDTLIDLIGVRKPEVIDVPVIKDNENTIKTESQAIDDAAPGSQPPA